jgi:hypothetical protein
VLRCGERATEKLRTRLAIAGQRFADLVRYSFVDASNVRAMERDTPKVAELRCRLPDNSKELIQKAFARLLDEYVSAGTVDNGQVPAGGLDESWAVRRYRRMRPIDGEPLEGRVPCKKACPPTPRSSDEIARILSRVCDQTCSIFLAHRRGMSYQDISKELRVSQRTVQEHVAHALLILMNQRWECE